MKKIASALTLIVAVALLTSASAAAYYISVNNSFQAENSLPTATPAPTSAPTPTLTPTTPPTSPKPTSAPTLNPTPTFAPFPESDYTEGVNAFLPLGVFGPTSPTNQTYNTNSLLLNVNGSTLVGIHVFADYSLDGGPRIPITLELTPLGTADKPSFQVRIAGSVALPPLDNGSHVVVMYGALGSKMGKVTVNFDIEGT